jgi:hypothetical protein
MRPQVRVCDSCTTRKSAPFQVGANFEPLSGRLQPGIRFFRALLPAPPTACLTAYLPRIRLQTDGGESGLPRSCSCRPESELNFTSQRACPFSVRPFPGSITTTYSYNPKEHPAACLFGSGLQAASARCCSRGLTTVHICYACGTCLASTPHCGLQRRHSPSPVMTSFDETLSLELRTRPLPVTHVQEGNCRSYGRSRHGNPRVTRQKQTLPSTTLPIYVRRTATRVARAYST